jgi:hypothetical protein
MTQGVKDLISAIVEGDAATIDAAFNAEMATRVSARLEDMRVSVAQNMFHAEQAVEETTEEVQEELTLEDYSAEEIQEFMQTEDFEQLDELSKTTLGSYVKKAGQQRVNLSGKEKELDDTVNGLQKAKHNVDNDTYSALSAAQDKVSKQRNAVTDKSLSRAKGIHTAIKKLTKEQVEEIEALAAKHGLGE